MEFESWHLEEYEQTIHTVYEFSGSGSVSDIIDLILQLREENTEAYSVFFRSHNEFGEIHQSLSISNNEMDIYDGYGAIEDVMDAYGETSAFDIVFVTLK